MSQVYDQRPDWDEFEIAWAAGYFDGEGSAGYYNGKGTYALNGSARLAIGGTQEVELFRFQSAVLGLGTVRGPYIAKGLGKKPMYKWQVQNFQGVQAVIALLWKYLSENKKTACLKTLKEYHAVRQT